MTRTTKSKKLEKWDKKYLWHPFTQHAVWNKEPVTVIESGQGAYLKDVDGHKFIDGVSSLWVNLLGHNHPRLNQAMKRQMSKVSHSTFLGLSHEPAIQLGKELSRLTPKDLTRTFFSDNGATAVEVALKMAFQYWLEKEKPRRSQIRKEFLALKGSYHGDTLGAVSVGSIGHFHSKFKPLLFKTQFAMAPSCQRCPFNKKKAFHRFRTGEKIKKTPKPGQTRPETGCRWECLSDVEQQLKRRSKKIAAAIIEPVVQGAAGMAVMPPGYVSGFEKLCRKYNVLLIADEVATGFGRTGRLFASELEGVQPDFLCVAKALTGGYTPLAATITKDKIFNAFKAPLAQGKTFFHGHSYTAHPLGAAVALENLKVIENTKLLEKTRHKAKLMKDALMELLKLPHVGSVRQAGLMIGVELVKDKKTLKPFSAHLRMGNRVCQKLLKKGVWLRPLGDTLVVMPPPIISKADLKSMMQKLRTVILHEIKS